MGGHAPDRMSEQMSNIYVPDRMSEHVPGRVSEHIPQNMSEYMPDSLSLRGSHQAKQCNGRGAKYGTGFWRSSELTD